MESRRHRQTLGQPSTIGTEILCQDLAETVFIDLSGDDAACFSGESDLDLSSIRVGTKRGLIGELKIVTGGQLNACRDEEMLHRG